MAHRAKRIIKNMLKLSKHITDLPVMSLRTGGKVAQTTRVIINPNNLRIEGWYCQDSLSHQTLILLAKDVRDFVPQGIAVNDHEDLSEPTELVRLQKILELDFELLGKSVVTNHKRKLGKVSDYAFDAGSMTIQKIYVSRPVYRSLTDGQLIIDRMQIIEINNHRILVRDADVREPSVAVTPAAATP